MAVRIPAAVDAPGIHDGADDDIRGIVPDAVFAVLRRH